MKYSRDGPINRTAKYRASFRRAQHVNKRFKKRVAEAHGHELLYSDINNSHGSSRMGECIIAEVHIGNTSQIADLTTFAMSHYVGWKTPDYNTSIGSDTQWKVNINLMDYSQRCTFMNVSNNKMYVTVWALTPRKDIAVNGLLPLNAIASPDQGQLPDVATDVHSGADVDFDAYHCRAITDNYIISRKKFFSVHAMSTFNVHLRNQVTYNIGTETDFGTDPDVLGSKRTFKSLLVKMVGHLGVHLLADNSSVLRHSPISYAMRQTTKARIQTSVDNRDVIKFEHLARQRYVPTVTASNVFVEEDVSIRPFVADEPSSTA